MIKNLGRFKQWTGEKFGGAKVTLQTDDFQKLEQETEHKREGYENIVSACDELHRYLLKKKPSPEDNKNKLMPYESLGTCLYHYSSVFPHDSALAISLVDLGQTQTRIAALQEVLASEIKNGYMSVLENGLQEYKDYDALRRKLELKRLDYDSKLNRLNKAKKEKPELEQEMQGAKMKYEDTEHDLIQKMAYLQEFENEHRDALFRLLEAECDYHTQAKELLESIKKDWGQGSTSDSTAFMSKVMMAREESTTSSSRQNSPSSIKSEKVRKASFDFSGQNDDEISFKIGDLITVIDEIDRGWWVGEANGKRGIFPVNFTEEYDSLTKELSQHSNSSSDSASSPKISQPRRSSSIRQRPPPPPPSTSSSNMPNNHTDSSIKRASNQPIPMTHTVSAPDVVSRNSMPPPPPASLSRNRSTAIRPPPPPPPVRSNTIDRVQRVVLE